MKIVFLFCCCLWFAPVWAQKNNIHTPDPKKKIVRVEAACGQCMFKLPGQGCELAVRVNGKAWYVSGTSLDDHGDAHATDGFCNAIRQADIQGKLKNNKYYVTYFKLIDTAAEKKRTPVDSPEYPFRIYTCFVAGKNICLMFSLHLALF